MTGYPAHAESTALIAADQVTVFDFLDDQANLASHMKTSSAMMLGSSMTIDMDADRTRKVGSHFGFTGKIFGIPLRVDEVVTDRDAPLHKAWETTGEPQLWVIGRYRMGFDLAHRDHYALLRVYIDYDLPASGLPRLLGHLFARFYARWCTKRMVSDARKHFAEAPVLTPAPT